jgi:hypothetical protein
MRAGGGVGKPSPTDLVGDALVVEAIKAAEPGLALITPHKGCEASVNIGAGDNVYRLQQARQRGAFCGVLVEPLPKQDSTKDKVAGLGAQTVPVGSAYMRW